MRFKNALPQYGALLSLLAALLVAALPAAAAEDYDDEAGVLPNYAIGVAIGLVDPDADVENYYTANLRIRLGDRDKSRDRASGGIRGYLEPEVAYWESDTVTDTLVGVNLIGLVPFRHVDYFFGVGAGAHFYDTDLTVAGVRQSESDTRLGMNAQFGIDVHVNDSMSVFGTGRFDLVQDSDDEVQNKLYIGLRFNL
jgi:hypothetical protein